MSNANRPAGLLPVGHAAGGTPQRTNDYRIAGGYGTGLYRGDIVKSTGTGKQIEKAAANERAVGVFAGCQFTDTDGAVVYKDYWPSGQSIQSGTEVTAWVYDDPNTVFEVQADEDIEEADIGAGAESVDDVGGNAATGTSGVELDSSTIAASAKQMKILDLVRRADNAYGTNAKVNVLLAKHELGGAPTAV